MSKAKRVGSWGDIPLDTFEKFAEAVEKLRDEMIPRDCDGDSPIKVVIVNKMTHTLSAEPVPRNEIYSYITHGYLEVSPEKQLELDHETELWLGHNVRAAAEEVDRHFESRRREWYDLQRDREPIAERIAKTCKHCKANIAFGPNEGDFYTKTRKKYPDFPFVYHQNNERCEAHKLRVWEWKQTHPDYDPVPVPRFCKKCGCKLRNEESRKGKNDQDQCLNHWCPNSKPRE
jgi:hypothetical protein